MFKSTPEVANSPVRIGTRVIEGSSAATAGDRAGRIAFGAVLLAGCAVLLHRVGQVGHLGRGLHAWAIFAGSWALAFLAAVVTRQVVRRSVARRGLDDLGNRGLLASLVVPGLGISLMLPLLVHLPFALWLGGRRGFDDWVVLSIQLVGPTHLALAALVTLRAVGLVRGWRLTPTVGQVYALTVFISCIPNILWLGIPVALVALTGVVFLPLLDRMRILVDEERTTLPSLPRAVVCA